MERRSKGWKYFGASDGTRPFEIEGVNVRDHTWVDTGETVNVTDPSYGLPYTFAVFEIEVDGRKVQFAAGEFSEGAWGYYTRTGTARK